MAINKDVLLTIARQKACKRTLEEVERIEGNIPPDVRSVLLDKLKRERYVEQMMNVFEEQFEAAAQWGRHGLYVHGAPFGNYQAMVELCVLARALAEVCDPIIDNNWAHYRLLAQW